jgi:hypothetical protein
MVRLLVTLMLGVAGLAGAAGLTMAAEAPAAPPAPVQQPSGAPGVLPIVPQPERVPVPPIEWLGLQSFPCRGSCPAFSVIFYADGTFKYSGESDVPRLGEGSGHVPTYFLHQVLRYVEAIGFGSLNDAYRTNLSDVRTTLTTVSWGKHQKVVENQDNSAPVTVWALEQLINELLALATWQ